MDSLYIIIPAYNEEANIRRVMEDWYPVAVQTGGVSRLVIIDDGSRDNTYKIMCEYAAARPQLIPLTKQNSGHGATVLYGYHYAIENHADYIFQTDSDGQTLSSEFARFWKLRRDYDMVIGHRKGREDGISRVMVTKTLKAIIRLCFKVTVTDANTPFRLMQTETLKKYIGLVPENFNLSNVIISVIYAKKGLKVKYIPITFKPRGGGGINSINMRKIIGIGKRALWDFREINKAIK